LIQQKIIRAARNACGWVPVRFMDSSEFNKFLIPQGWILIILQVREMSVSSLDETFYVFISGLRDRHECRGSFVAVVVSASGHCRRPGDPAKPLFF
jgi:hypothetical protein